MGKQLSRLPPGKLVTTDQYNELLDWVKERTNIKCGPGMEVRNMAGGMFVSLVHSPLSMSNQTAGQTPPDPGTTADQFFARIEAVIPTAYPTRWTYTARRVKKHTQGEDHTYWTVQSGYGEHEAFNLYEAINGTTGVQGNGVDIDGADFPATMAVMPCPVGSIVRVWTVVADDASVEWWFAHANAIDGLCE